MVMDKYSMWVELKQRREHLGYGYCRRAYFSKAPTYNLFCSSLASLSFVEGGLISKN